jgi:hypothetical protein
MLDMLAALPVAVLLADGGVGFGSLDGLNECLDSERKLE